MKPTSSGKPYEILLVADTEYFQDGLVDSLTALLEQPVPGLPQVEESFEVSKIASQSYSSTLRYCRNIIIVNIDRTFTAPKIKFAQCVCSSADDNDASGSGFGVSEGVSWRVWSERGGFLHEG